MYENLAVMAVFIMIYSMAAGWVEQRPLSGPIIFLCFGLAMGPLGLDLLRADVSAKMLRTLAELCLALVLFSDAGSANLRVLRKSSGLTTRLLLIGLPLTIGLGFLAGMWLFPHMHLLQVALLAVILAPTDASLGAQVITNPAVPDRLREALNAESGLNDGICVPVLYLFLTLAVGTEVMHRPVGFALSLFAEEIGIGLLAGLVVTALGVWVWGLANRRGWVEEAWFQMPVPAMAVAAFSVAQALGGSGFIAAFAGGILFDSLIQHRKQELMEAAEGIGNTLGLITWVIFGFAVVGQALPVFSWPMLVYAVLSLTLIRMLPVYLVLAGTGESPASKLFLGWFGPRGMASIVFIILVLEAKLPGARDLAMTVVCTIILSVIAHGLSAFPLANALGRREK
ncbi:MAG: cation:proton antiporter [Deltaproteobacteria bacterium]|nr:cation:proton antiporter [Deltaproteobacteria bacterium]